MSGGWCATERPAGSAVLLSAESLPPLPKGLSGVLSSSGGSWRDIEKVHSKRARIQADINRGGGDAPRDRSRAGGLDAALALLRKEMVGLRQLDMSLLCQLWSLHEAIQEFKGCSLFSEAFSTDNGYFEEEDDEGDRENEEVTGVLSQPPLPSSSLSVPGPGGSSRDQWIKDALHIS